MSVLKRTAAVLSGAGLIVLAAAAPSPADPGGPTITYFKAANPVVGSTLSNASSMPSISLKEGWTVQDPDGVCSADTTYTRTGDTVWSYSGGANSVHHDYTFTQLAGQTEYLDTFASDCLSNDSSGETEFTPNLVQQSAATYSAGWTNSSNSAFSGGSVKTSSKAGSSATYTFSNAGMVALVSDNATGRGTVSLSVDGGMVSTVNLKGPTKNRVIVWKSGSFSYTTSHKLTIKVVSGRVDIDAFVTSQQNPA